MDVHKCEHCPLNSDTHPTCPLAARIVDAVTRFGNVLSYEEVEVTVETPERTVVKKTTAQHGVSALMGLVMATSGCPRTAFFKPMAAFHLPIANVEETLYRATSMYMLGQYFVHKRGGEADLNMGGLVKVYEDLEILNGHLAKRVREAIQRDAAVNAIVILDFFAKSASFRFEEKLGGFAPLFEMYTDHSGE